MYLIHKSGAIIQWHSQEFWFADRRLKPICSIFFSIPFLFLPCLLSHLFVAVCPFSYNFPGVWDEIWSFFCKFHNFCKVSRPDFKFSLHFAVFSCNFKWHISYIAINNCRKLVFTFYHHIVVTGWYHSIISPFIEWVWFCLGGLKQRLQGLSPSPSSGLGPSLMWLIEERVLAHPGGPGQNQEGRKMVVVVVVVTCMAEHREQTLSTLDWITRP